MITYEDVASWLNISGATDPWVPGIVDATNSFIELVPTKPVIETGVDPDGNPIVEWAPQTRTAAVMFAARLYRRRNSANGIEAMNDQGTSYVARYDPDIARLLRIDSFNLPMIG